MEKKKLLGLGVLGLGAFILLNRQSDVQQIAPQTGGGGMSWLPFNLGSSGVGTPAGTPYQAPSPSFSAPSFNFGLPQGIFASGEDALYTPMPPAMLQRFGTGERALTSSDAVIASTSSSIAARNLAATGFIPASYGTTSAAIGLLYSNAASTGASKKTPSTSNMTPMPQAQNMTPMPQPIVWKKVP